MHFKYVPKSSCDYSRNSVARDLDLGDLLGFYCVVCIIEICSIVVLGVYLPCLKHKRKSINILSFAILKGLTQTEVSKKDFIVFCITSFGYFASLNMTKDRIFRYFFSV